MKKVLLILTLFFATIQLSFAGNFTNTYPLPGKTQCDTRLQADVIVTITNFVDYLAGNSCQSYQVTNTQTIQDFGLYKQPSTGITWHPWEEAWTIKVCSKTYTLNVGFKQDISSGTGTSFAVTNAEKLMQQAKR